MNVSVFGEVEHGGLLRMLILRMRVTVRVRVP